MLRLRTTFFSETKTIFPREKIQSTYLKQKSEAGKGKSRLKFMKLYPKKKQNGNQEIVKMKMFVNKLLY